MITWIVKRHGSNAANQPMTSVMVLGTVAAVDDAAAKLAAEEMWGCYANQHFEVIDLAGRTRREDREAAAAADADTGEAMAEPVSYEVRTIDSVENLGLTAARFATRAEAQEAADFVNSEFPRAGAEVIEVTGLPTTTFAAWNEAGW